MNSSAAVGTVIGAVIVLVMLFPILAAAGGYFCGWIVEMIFTETSAKMLAFAGMSDFTLAEVGAALGFVGMFFRSVTSSNK